jgi:hypothetical protein
LTRSLGIEFINNFGVPFFNHLMKLILTMVVALIATLVTAESEVLEYEDEFLKGMETGFFIRN